MQTRSARRRVPLLVVASMVLVGLVAPNPAGGQDRLEDIDGYQPPENATLIDDGWIDPAARFGLNESSLAPTPEFDFGSIAQSTVIAAGLEQVSTDAEDDIVIDFEERHLRVLQVADTLVRNIDRADVDIDRATARLGRSEDQARQLDEEIEAERAEESRLADKIHVRNEAIIEFAIRAFTGENQLELVLAEPDTDFLRSQVVTEEVHDELQLQISALQEETAVHEAQRVVLETELVGVETQIEELEGEIDALDLKKVELNEFLEETDELAKETAESYELALHTRLNGFVDETDIPYVALNAYVIAARTLETEDPVCQIHWSHLAGIGRIESFHGNFGDSELDINGHTTEDIRGLALDGRILSGAEFLENGADAPAATGRTEDLAVTPAEPAAPAAPAGGGEPAAPAQAPAPAPEAAPPAPAAEPAPAPAPEPAPAPAGGAEAPAPAADGEAPAAGEGAAAPAAPAAPAPPPVIKRLALILDSDDGELDGDTTFDRAVGPMQFIPTTWELFDSDGNGDGETDPQNIYDAALASARYLCASTVSMATPEGEQRAYFAYNHDLDYSNNVTNAGRGYRAVLEIEDPEIEDGSGRYYLGISEGVTGSNEPSEEPEDEESAE